MQKKKRNKVLINSNESNVNIYQVIPQWSLFLVSQLQSKFVKTADVAFKWLFDTLATNELGKIMQRKDALCK